MMLPFYFFIWYIKDYSSIQKWKVAWVKSLKRLMMFLYSQFMDTSFEIGSIIAVYRVS